MPYWNRLGFDELEYPFAAPAVNVTALIGGVHPSDFANPKVLEESRAAI